MLPRALLLLSFAASLSSLPVQDHGGNDRAARLGMANPEAQAAYTFLQEEAKTIADAKVRATVQGLLSDPAPTFLERWPDREAALQALEKAGMFEEPGDRAWLTVPIADLHHSPLSFLTAPGGTPDHHHAYPGGLAVHEAFNLRSALDIARNLEKSYRLTLDHDTVVAAPILHDMMKAWVLQWQEDGTMTDQGMIGGTAGHHVLGLAESIHRGLPAKVVLAQACAHDPFGGSYPQVVARWLKAGAILAKEDPVRVGLLTSNGSLALPIGMEALANNLADHAYVLEDPAGARVAEALNRLARAAEPGRSERELRWMRLRVESRVEPHRLYEWLVEGGDARLAAELARLKIPLADPVDAFP